MLFIRVMWQVLWFMFTHQTSSRLVHLEHPSRDARDYINPKWIKEPGAGLSNSMETKSELFQRSVPCQRKLFIILSFRTETANLDAPKWGDISSRSEHCIFHSIQVGCRGGFLMTQRSPVRKTTAISVQVVMDGGDFSDLLLHSRKNTCKWVNGCIANEWSFSSGEHPYDMDRLTIHSMFSGWQRQSNDRWGKWHK